MSQGVSSGTWIVQIGCYFGGPGHYTIMYYCIYILLLLEIITETLQNFV